MANLCPRCLYIYIVEFAVLDHRSASFCVLCRPYSCFITGVVALLFYAGCRGLDALPDNTAHAADAHHVRLSEYHFLILPWHNFFWSSKGTLLFILPYMAESLEHCTRCMCRCWLGAVLRILFFRGDRYGGGSPQAVYKIIKKGTDFRR